MWWVNPSLVPSGFLLSILLLPTKDHFSIIRVHPFFLSKSQQMMEKYVPDALEWKLKSIFLYHPSYTFWLYWCAISVSLRTQSCLPLWDPMDCNPQVPLSMGFFFQARILEWVAISSSSRSSQLRDQIRVSCIFCMEGWILYHWATWEASTIV